MGTPRFLSASNAFLPQPTGTVVNFVRDPKKFPINRYVQVVNHNAKTGTYFTFDRDQPVRAVAQGAFAFSDGDTAPQGNANLNRFSVDEFMLKRYAYPFTLGEDAVDAARSQGGWDPIALEAASVASQAMTFRTNEIISYLDTSGNWPSTNTDTAANLGGGKWDVSTVAQQYMYKGLMTAVRKIRLLTNNAVEMDDLRLVISSTDAVLLRSSPEVVDFVKGSVHTWPMLTGELTNPNAAYGLPPKIYGVELVVEDTMKVTTNPVAAGTAGTRAYAKTGGVMLLLTRPGALNGHYGTKSYSTAQIYTWKYDMSVEAQYDAWNKRHEGRVVDQYVGVYPALLSGFCITAATG